MCRRQAPIPLLQHRPWHLVHPSQLHSIPAGCHGTALRGLQRKRSEQADDGQSWRPEGMTLNMLLNRTTGFLLDSSGTMVMEHSTDLVEGDYRFFAAGADERLPWESVQHSGCIKQDTGIWKAEGERSACCLMGAHLRHPPAPHSCTMGQSTPGQRSQPPSARTCTLKVSEQPASLTAAYRDVVCGLGMPRLTVAQILSEILRDGKPPAAPTSIPPTLCQLSNIAAELRSCLGSSIVAWAAHAEPTCRHPAFGCTIH